MNVRWTAVLTGFVVVVLIGTLLVLLIGQEVFVSPDLTRPGDLILFSLPIILTTVSGYVAGRMAKTSRVLNGFLVQIVGILISQIAGPISPIQVISYAIASLFAALGGYLSRYPAEQTSHSSQQ